MRLRLLLQRSSLMTFLVMLHNSTLMTFLVILYYSTLMTFLVMLPLLLLWFVVRWTIPMMMGRLSRRGMNLLLLMMVCLLLNAIPIVRVRRPVRRWQRLRTLGRRRGGPIPGRAPPPENRRRRVLIPMIPIATRLGVE